MDRKKYKLLIVDDEISGREGLRELITSWGYECETADNGEDALNKIQQQEPSFVIADLLMPKMDGIELLKRIKADYGDILVIILTAQGTIDSAVISIKEGAYDYLTKPLDIVRLKKLLENLTSKVRIQKEMELLQFKLKHLGSFGELIGQSKVMREIFHLIELAAPSSASVLISGSSGTGKELVAREIHKRSPRSDKPFIAINCAAIPETLLESEIFGHEKGAFTGAINRKEGCFEFANGGTLFLDEIVEMPAETQTKFLRVLEDGKFRRVGGKEELSVDVRVLAASNKNFEDAMKNGTLRQDVYYRLNVFNIVLPPLIERTEDIPFLATSFIDEFNKKNNKNVRSIDEEAMELLQTHTWPGNIRELKNVIERAVIICEKDIILGKDLPLNMQKKGHFKPKISFQLGVSMDDVEKELLKRTIEYSGGNKTKAADMLNISLKTLHNKINKYQLR